VADPGVIHRVRLGHPDPDAAARHVNLPIDRVRRSYRGGCQEPNQEPK
jgi:hypothetical protein